MYDLHDSDILYYVVDAQLFSVLNNITLEKMKWQISDFKATKISPPVLFLIDSNEIRHIIRIATGSEISAQSVCGGQREPKASL